MSHPAYPAAPASPASSDPATAPPDATPPDAAAPAGLKVIIGYKFAKAALELLLGAAFLAFRSLGLVGKLVSIAQAIRHHATEAWSIALAEWLLDASTAHHVIVVALAVSADGIVTLIEAWALQRRYRWSGWLVIGTSASLLPFEVDSIRRHPSVGHIVLLLVNLGIVAYLVRREVKERHA